MLTFVRPYLDLLRDGRLRTIWIGETINAFGSGLTFWALAWLLYRAYPKEPLLSATLLAVLSAATILGTLTLGTNLDRWDRRRVLLGVNAALAVLTAFVPLITRADWGTLPLLALVGAIGLLRSLPAPALSATLPSLVPAERLPSLTALFNLTWMTGELFAPVAAGVLISQFGAGTALWLDAATFGVAAALYALVRFPLQPKVEAHPDGGLRGWWAQTSTGWRFVLAKPALWGMFLGLSAVNGFFETFGALLLPRVGERLLGVARGPLGVGVLDSLSVGVEMLASLWLGRQVLKERFTRPLILLGCVLPVVTAVGLVLAPNYPVALGLAFLNGLGFAPLSVLVAVFVARCTPAPLLGRVSSVRFFFGNASRPLAMTAAGALLPLLGVGPLALVLGAAALALTTFGYWQGKRADQQDLGDTA